MGRCGPMRQTVEVVCIKIISVLSLVTWYLVIYKQIYFILRRVNAMDTDISFWVTHSLKINIILCVYLHIVYIYIGDIFIFLCNRPNSCQYCCRISRTGNIMNHHNRTYSTITSGSCQSNNLIYCLECNICNMKYVGQMGSNDMCLTLSNITILLLLDISSAMIVQPTPVSLSISLNTLNC